MMLERTLARVSCHSLSAGRLRTRCFHAWSGAALSRYFQESDKDESQLKSPRRKTKSSAPNSDEEEMTTRREQLQELLQQVNAEKTHEQKTR